MKCYTLILAAILLSFITHAQVVLPLDNAPNTGNIYQIKKQFQEHVARYPAENDTSKEDNNLEQFNRWFHFVEPRCYPSGNLPRPDVVLREYEKAKLPARNAQRTTTAFNWQPLGPNNIPWNFFGVGRVNCIVINPVDTNTLYVGTACGGVWISHNDGLTWTSNSDNFPSLSVADIAVNPHNTDTIYAATGDGYGFEETGSALDPLFWGGLYSAGIMKSTDGGNTWNTTGLSYLQTDEDIIQRLLIHPNNPNILLAATRQGIYRTADAGATWSLTDTGHVYSMEFRPGTPDTVYAIDVKRLKASYDAGITWNVLDSNINDSDRSTIAVSAASPNSIWVVDYANNLLVSHNNGLSFDTLTSPESVVDFYGYYGKVLAVSPTDTNTMYAGGIYIGISTDGGMSWNVATGVVHPDNHAITINPLNPNTVYDGDDGGIFVSYDGANTWSFIDSGLMISQVYRMSSSQQNPYIMLCGLQDNGTFYNNGTNWVEANVPLADGMDNAICPLSDSIQIAGWQNGNFLLSYDQGATFNEITSSTVYTASWTSPVVFDPNNADTIYFGLGDIYASYDMGVTFNQLTFGFFPSEATSMALCPSNTNVLYAADYGDIYVTTDAGTTWANITSSLPASGLAITGIAVDRYNPMLVYVTVSGYLDGSKVFVSSNGGAAWSNISAGLPNVPADCVATDFSTPGALFVGTDMGLYYMDSSSTWAPYGTGLPNVIVDDIDINYTNYKVRAATYGRGIWECRLKATAPPASVTLIPSAADGVQLFPNPTTGSWKVVFPKQQSAKYLVQIIDMNGRILHTQKNTDIIDASKLASGMYTIEISAGSEHYNIPAIKE